MEFLLLFLVVTCTFQHLCVGESSTYVSYGKAKSMHKYGFPLMNAVLRENVDLSPDDDIRDDFVSTRLKCVFDHFKNSNDKVMGIVNNKLANKGIKVCNQSGDVEKCIADIIKLYTRAVIYKGVNDALNKQGTSNYNPTDSDKNLGTYALILDSILMYWTKLQKNSKKTYRGLGLSNSDLSQYSNGTLFSWLAFTSSTTDMMAAITFMRSTSQEKKVLFIINNKGGSSWRPRDVAKFSQYPDEKEGIYPAGAFFKVTSVKKKGLIQYTEIMLDLTDDVNRGEKMHTGTANEILIIFCVVYIVLGDKNY